MLESQRGFLFIAFAALSFYLWVTWQQDAHPKPVEPLAAATETITTGSVAPTSAVETELPAQPAEAEAATTALSAQNRFVELSNDKLRIVIDRVGGDIVESDLLAYHEELGNDKPIRLLQSNNNRSFIAQSGITDQDGPRPAAERATYELQSRSQDALTLSWTSADGIKISKRFQLQQGSHLVQLTFAIDNQSQHAFVGRVYTQFKRDRVEVKSAQASIGAYTGAAFGDQEKRYNKFSFSDMDKAAEKAPGKLNTIAPTTANGWVAFLQHYFVTAWVPESASGNDLYSLVLDNQQTVIGIKQAMLNVAAGTQASASAKLYVGPKVQQDLAQISNGLDLTVDYGFLWWIGQPLFAALKWLHGLLGNWGLAIIFLTLGVKMALYPLSAAQYRSFGKMRKLQPKLEALKERHGDDRQAFGQAMMELYKTEKVNPLGGCFPLLLQMPVFFALYWVLSESVEMRQAPFYFWIHDLSVMDPYYVLPVLMGISMWFTQKMQPPSPTMDPMQQKIMQFMPVMMTVFFVWAPAGLVLYWFMNNLISMGQQWYVTRKMAHDDQKKK